MKETDTPPTPEKAPEPKDSKKPNQVSGTMWVWFIIALAVFLGLTYKDKLLKEEDSKKIGEPTTEEVQSEKPNSSEATAKEPAPTPAPVAATTTRNEAPTLPLLENGQLLSSVNGLTKLLLLTDKDGLKCTINDSGGQTKAQFQLVEIQALHRTPPVHVATLPADLGTIRLYVVQEIQELSHQDGSIETRITGLNLTSEGQTETQHYRLQGNSLTLLTPEELHNAPEPKKTTSSSPALFMLKGK